MRRILIVLFAALSLAAPALAGTSPPGVNLRWDNCFGDGGVWNKTFACDTNSGSERLIGSFELASEMPQASGLEIYMNLGSAAAAFPVWWQLFSAGACRPTSLRMIETLPAGTVNCEDWSGGQAAGGIGTYNIGAVGPGTAIIKIAVAVPSSELAHLYPGVEYYAFTLTIDHAKTVGTGACSGCDAPVCIFTSVMRVLTPAFVDSAILTRGANYSGSQYATWQNGYPANIHQGPCVAALGEFCHQFYQAFSCVPYDVTPTRNTTWGAVKSLYR